jgi:hypothetical protein
MRPSQPAAAQADASHAFPPDSARQKDRKKFSQDRNHQMTPKNPIKSRTKSKPTLLQDRARPPHEIKTKGPINSSVPCSVLQKPRDNPRAQATSSIVEPKPFEPSRYLGEDPLPSLPPSEPSPGLELYRKSPTPTPISYWRKPPSPVLYWLSLPPKVSKTVTFCRCDSVGRNLVQIRAL